MKFEAKCMYMNTTNINGVFYPEDVVRNAFAKYVPRVLDYRSFGTIDNPKIALDLEKISHKITNISLHSNVDGGYVEVTGEPFPIPGSLYNLGKHFDNYLSHDVQMSINPIIIGTIDDVDGVPTLGMDAKIIRFDITIDIGMITPQNIIKRI